MEPDVGGSNPPSCTKLMNKKTFKPSIELPVGFVDRKEEELLARDLLVSNIKKIMAKYGFNILKLLVSNLAIVLENFYLIKIDHQREFFLLRMIKNGYHYDMI